MAAIALAREMATVTLSSIAVLVQTIVMAIGVAAVIVNIRKRLGDRYQFDGKTQAYRLPECS